MGRRPEEFGLVPENDGFVTYKELLKAIHEEPGWQYVRQSHINEVLLGKDRFLFEADEKGIRAVERKWHLDGGDICPNPVPKVLFTAVRRKAHPVIVEKGLKSGPGKYLILSPDENMSLRIGKRRDPKPVLLRVEAARGETEGVRFHSFGDLFVSTIIPAKFISGPPVEKDLSLSRKETEPKPQEKTHAMGNLSPGTFSLDFSGAPGFNPRTKGKKRKGWKKTARKVRKRKR